MVRAARTSSPQTKITLTCSVEQRKRIRMLAAQEDKSMNDFLLSLVKEKEKHCKDELHKLLLKGFQESCEGKGREITDADIERWEKI